MELFDMPNPESDNGLVCDALWCVAAPVWVGPAMWAGENFEEFHACGECMISVCWTATPVAIQSV